MIMIIIIIIIIGRRKSLPRTSRRPGPRSRARFSGSGASARNRNKRWKTGELARYCGFLFPRRKKTETHNIMQARVFVYFNGEIKIRNIL